MALISAREALAAHPGLRVSLTPVAPDSAETRLEIADRFGINSIWRLSAGARPEAVEECVRRHIRYSMGLTGRN